LIKLIICNFINFINNLINYRIVPGSGINNETLAIVETNYVSIFDKQALHTATNIKTGKQEIVAQNTFNDTLNNTQPASIS